MLFALLSALLAALDVGRLYLAQRELQKLANFAALDAARAVGGCRGAVADPAGTAAAAARASIAANEADAAILDHSLSAVELGVIQSAGGIRSFVASAPEDAVAVNVILVNPAPSRLVPLFSTGAGNLRAEAAAFSAPMAAISVGSSLVNLDSSDSALLSAVLGGLLGGSLSLDAVSYRGLANAQVTLQQLVDTGVVAGDIGDFLSTEISAPTFLTALGAALSDSDPALAALVDSIAAAADPGRTVLPGALFPVEQGLESLAGALPVNAADLLGAIALAAAQGAPVNLVVPVNLPGVANATLQLEVIEPPQFGGPGRPGFRADGEPRVQARTAQVEARLALTLAPIGLLAAELRLDLALAQAIATLTGISCASPGQPFHTATVDVATDIAALSANLRIPLIGVDLDAVSEVGSDGSELLFEGPFVPQIPAPSPENTQRVGTAPGEALANALSDLSGSLIGDLPVVGILLRPLLTSLVNTVLNPLFLVLDDAVLNPLFEILGLSLGSADVTLESLRVSQPDPFGDGDRPYVELVTH